jgi:hypothetical protein
MRMGLGSRLIGWAAAYALVLHAVLAGAVATQLAASATAPDFEICLGDPDGAPMPGHGQTQHENCAIHCATVAGGLAALAVALIALIFRPRSAPLAPRRVFDPAIALLCRAGRCRAPPRPA